MTRFRFIVFFIVLLIPHVATGEETGETALHYAATRGDIEVVKLLLKAGADVNARGNVVVVLPNDNPMAILQRVDAKMKNGGTALHWAAYEGQVEVVKLLLEAGADVNARTKAGRTALFLAVFNNKHGDIVKLLLEAGAKPRKETP